MHNRTPAQERLFQQVNDELHGQAEHPVLRKVHVGSFNFEFDDRDSNSSLWTLVHCSGGGKHEKWQKEDLLEVKLTYGPPSMTITHLDHGRKKRFGVRGDDLEMLFSAVLDTLLGYASGYANAKKQNVDVTIEVH